MYKKKFSIFGKVRSGRMIIYLIYLPPQIRHCRGSILIDNNSTYVDPPATLHDIICFVQLYGDTYSLAKTHKARVLIRST